MVDNLSALIDEARIQGQRRMENSGKPDTSMPESGHSPFDSSLSSGRSLDKRSSRAGSASESLETQSYRWAEGVLRCSGSTQDRTLMAVRDAARMAARKSRDPGTVPFYVGSTIAKGWNLSPRQLCEGLKMLEKASFIRVVCRRKGLHQRMTLAPQSTG